MNQLLLRSSFLAPVLALLLAFSAPAQWPSGGNLPGLKSGGDVAKDLALWGGIGAGAGLAYYFLFAKDGPVVAASPKRLAIQGSAGEQTEAVLRVVNTAKSAVEVRSVRVDGGIFTSETSPLPKTLLPDGVLEVRVGFAPKATQRYEGELRVVAHKAGKDKESTLRVPLVGDGRVSRGAIRPEPRWESPSLRAWAALTETRGARVSAVAAVPSPGGGEPRVTPTRPSDE